MTTATSNNPAKLVPIPKNGVDYRGKIVLAPMVRSGELPSRLCALKYGANLVWGPETIDKALIGTTRRENPRTGTIDFTRTPSNASRNQLQQETSSSSPQESLIYRLHPAREGAQLIYQIGTADPTTAVQAATLIAPDVTGIDVNAGCPKPFSTSGGMGAALLKTPDRLCAILTALVEQVGRRFEVGISVKIRLLDTVEETRGLVARLCATGITGLTVHCRTTPMRPRERAIRDERLKAVAEVCREAGVACLMNGDVASREEALGLIEEFGVDGAMIATAAETNPSVFRTESEGGKATWEEVIREYVRTAIEVENRFGNTKYLLCQMIPGKQKVCRAVMATKSYSELIGALGYEDELGGAANDLDRLLEIGAFERQKMSKSERKAANKAAAKANKENAQSGRNAANTAGVKRKAETAGLDVQADDAARESGPGSIPEQASVLAV